MLLLIYAQRQTCIADMLSAIIAVFASIKFVKVCKILTICGHFWKPETL